MTYVTVKQSPAYRQMTLDEFLFQSYQPSSFMINLNTTNTRTYEFDKMSDRFIKRLDVEELISKLADYINSVEKLLQQDRGSLYKSFKIPKKSGGLRQIDAPEPELMDALRRLKTIFEEDFHVLYHTSAFAYIKNRCTIDAIKKHQKNESKWFGKFDLKDFFGSTTLDYVMDMFSMIYPFSEVVKRELGKELLRRSLSLAFLNGGLPQGTPISPLITNVMMIPIDYKLSKILREFNKQKFVYTRYADDFIISSKFEFDARKIESLINEVLSEFNAPFSINSQKTRYGSSAGRNWNLGVMLNKDNQITVGHKRKKQLQSMLYNYITDKRKGIAWLCEDIMSMQGIYSYYRMVEKDTIDAIIRHINAKMGVDVLQLIKEDLK